MNTHAHAQKHLVARSDRVRIPLRYGVANTILSRKEVFMLTYTCRLPDKGVGFLKPVVSYVVPVKRIEWVCRQYVLWEGGK